MNKSVLILAAAFITAGCSDHDAENSMQTKDNARGDYFYDNDEKNNDTDPTDYGYTRMSRTIIVGENIRSKTPPFDREKMASAISKLCIQLPDVKDAASLVTDNEVLIVYKTDAKDRDAAADQVKRSAASIVPRYYHIYVSDNYRLTRDIENFSSLGTDSANVDDALESVIQRMLESPQGSKLSEDENENGELISEKDSGHNHHIKLDTMQR